MNEGNGFPVVLSFDVEEHHRIEAAAHLACPPELQARYAGRTDETTRWLLDVLAEKNARATFFVVGPLAKSHPALVRKMVEAGHEVASHSWAHRRAHRFTPASFREDILASKDALEQASGAAVFGYRAPTFSIMRETAWAIDVLVELGFRYDSSVFPVHHDRYGVPEAPRTPFLVRGYSGEILELPATTLRMFGQNLPVAGGGYFRLFPLFLMEHGIRQLAALPQSAAVLYFHPWEFDPEQPKLPLSGMSKFRTYVGIGRSRRRLKRLLSRHHFVRMMDVAAEFDNRRDDLPRFPLAARAA
jgi:polysaccharide deacetylase family protein (PEP-CTERM system associated)